MTYIWAKARKLQNLLISHNFIIRHYDEIIIQRGNLEPRSTNKKDA